jgi:hypothetical protein
LDSRFLLPGCLAVGLVGAIAIHPLLGLAGVFGVCFLAAYVYRRDWLLGGIFIFLLLQNLIRERLLPISPSLAQAVKHADDVLIVFFMAALAGEAFLPRLRLREIPLVRPFALLLAVLLFSAAYNRLPATTIGVGSYVLLKNFTWFYLAASLHLTDRDYRRVFRFLAAVLGALLAFAAFQLATGDLTYDLLGLPKDYRFGILRLRGIFVHPVWFTETMALLATLGLGAYVQLRKPRYLGLAVGAVAAVVLTMLLKTVMALFLALGLLLLRKRPVLFVPCALAAVVSMAMFGKYGIENIELQYMTYIETPQSVRREGYRIAGEIVRDSPVLGVGPGMFGGFAASLLDSPIPEQYGFINYDGKQYSTFESHWPHLVAEIGLVGLAVYLWFLLTAAWTAWRLAHRTGVSPYFRALAMAAPVFLVCVMIEGFAAANMEDALCGIMVFGVLGLVQRMPRPARSGSPSG